MAISKPSVKKNFIYSSLYQVFNVLTPFVVAPYVARVIGAEGIGIQSYTASIQSYFLLFASLGTMTYGAREISMNRDDEYVRSKLFWEIELMTVGTSLLAVAAWLIFIVFAKTYRLYYIVLTIGIFAAMFDITWFFNGIEAFKLTVIRNVIFKIIGIICLFVFIKSRKDLLLYVLITSITTLASSLSMWPYMSRYLVKVDFKDLRFRKHIRETMVYFIPTIATSVYTVLDRTLIGLITHDMAENGYYQQAEKIIGIAKSIVFTAINSVVGVRIAYLYSENKYEEIQRRIENSFNYIFFMGFGCAFGIAGIAKRFVPLYLGPGYDRVIPLLYVFCPIVVVIGISNCLGNQYYTPCGKRALSAKFIISGAVLNFLLNIVFIPRAGAIGAAIASLLAEVLITVLYIRFSGTFGNVKMLYSCGIRKLIAGMIMFIPVFYLNNLKINSLVTICIQVVSGVLIYLFVLLILKDRWTCGFIAMLRERFRR